MYKKIFVFESNDKKSLNFLDNVINLELMNDESFKYRKYDDVSDAFASEYTDDFVSTVYKNEPEEYNCLSSGIPLNKLKNHISDNIKKHRYYENEISDAIEDELCQLSILTSKSDGVEKFNKMYEIKKRRIR